jgi:hypothetical protein
MQKIVNRPILLALIVLGACIGTYVVGAFYHQFINSPIDFASLIFIIVIYVGAAYHQLRGFEKNDAP